SPHGLTPPSSYTRTQLGRACGAAPASDEAQEHLVFNHTPSSRAIFRVFDNIRLINKELERHKEHVSTIDSSILAKAFRGELVPQDPNDEPASVLLERIAAERAAAPTSSGKKARSRRTKHAAE